MVFVLEDGDFTTASFAWTKNEVLDHFDYDGKNQRFKALPGAELIAVGVLSVDSNIDRLSVEVPALTDLLSYPIRVSVGGGSGVSFGVTLVTNDAAFGVPPVGTVELSRDTGNLNWNAADLVSYEGQPVRFQRQRFYEVKDSGKLGLIDTVLLLNPLPTTGQHPLVRINTGSYIEPVEKPTEAAFSANPVAGTVEWALNTGRLKFNSSDVSANLGKSIYYDGCCFGFGLQLTPIAVGTLTAPGVLAPLPSTEADVYFLVPGVVRFQNTKFVTTLSSEGKQNQVEIRTSDGQVRFSLADQDIYGPLAVFAVVPDLSIDHGLALRLLRTPADLGATNPDLNDTSARYTTQDALLADPVIRAPQVFLPATPDDSQPITVTVAQGSGFFVGALPRLDVASPPVSYGFVLDTDSQALRFARRRQDIVIAESARVPYGAVQLADPLIFESNLVLELEDSPGAGTYTPLILNTDVLFDYNPGLARLLETEGISITSGSAGSMLSTTFTDTTQNFILNGVVAGDYLVILSGASKGVYIIGTVSTTYLIVNVPGTTESGLLYEVRRGREILADRFFKSLAPVDPNTEVKRLRSLGTATNSPRLSVDLVYISVSGFRFGKTDFATTVLVPNDAAFTSPVAGTVELSEATGNLNFSTADLGKTVYWARTLTSGIDYKVQPVLGFIQFTDRFLELEEVVVTYAVMGSDNNKVVVANERGTFIVRKELTLDHPITTDTLYFNPLGRELAANPAPRAFRGGRPQTSSKVVFDIAASSVIFIGSTEVTTPFPAGPVLPDERVYVDYYVYEAVGGEDSITVLRPPMLGVLITITEGEASFQILGDRTSEFLANYLLKVDGSEVYLLGTPSYDPIEDLTTVCLSSPQVFKSDLHNPALAISSGPTRTSGTFFNPSYFVTELGSYEAVPRGSNKLRLLGDFTQQYVPGTAILWTDGVSTFDFNVVEGSTFSQGRTEAVLSSNGFKQYASPVILKRSSRPILADSARTVNTSKTPVLDLPFLVYRRIDGQVGEILEQPEDYSIDGSGKVSFTEPLRDNEELCIFYSGSRVISDGRSFRASYTHVVAPSVANGLEGQVLRMTYTTYVPDSFYWRVETFTNFRAELMTDWENDAKASIPSGGPRLENSGSPRLSDQGRKSAYFPEKHLANQDIVARVALKYINDGINFMEDALQSLDGRAVGDHDGRFKFDGLLSNPPRLVFSDVTNQIDDLLKVADGPPVVTFPPFAVTFAGTYQQVYKPSPFSRFYPTSRRLSGVSIGPTGLADGDTILDTQFKNFNRVSAVRRRQPWAIVTRPALVGEATLTVDTADGSEELLRPPFDSATYTHRVAIVDQNGTFLVTEALPKDVVFAGGTTITLATLLTVDVPIGSTIYQVGREDPLLPSVSPYPKFYRVGFDVGVDLEGGVLTHVEPFPPYDGSGGLPPSLDIVNPSNGEVLDVWAKLNNTLTEPSRFPALDGGTSDDDWNRLFPLLTPSVVSENGAVVGFLQQERAIIETPTGSLRTITTASLVDVGSLDAARTRITLDAGTFSPPIPKTDDLVRILSGFNAGLEYRRIVGVGPSFVDVSNPWPSQEAGITFTVTASNSLEVGTGNLTTPTHFSDVFVDFIADGVKIGHTLVITSGANAGLRRQITAVGALFLDVEAFPVSSLGVGYRVDDPLSTFGGTGSLLEELKADLDGELGALHLNTPPDPYNETDALELFLDQFFTNLVTSASGQVLAGGGALTDLTKDFTALGVTVGNYVFIRSGINAGSYRVTLVGTTTLDIDGTFPNNEVGMTYRVVDAGDLSQQTLADVLGILLEIDQEVVLVGAFRMLVTTPIAVLNDSGAFARATITNDLDVREAGILTRETQILTAISKLTTVLASSDRLYDKRFTWIDSRINLETGTLVKQERSRQQRLKANAETLKQLTKMALR